MQRREFLIATAGAAAAAAPVAAAASGTTAAATILFDDHAITVPKAREQGGDLWVPSAQLPEINGFTLKPQGACREDVCIPISKDLRHGSSFNLSGFGRKLHQVVASDSGVWSFGEIPLLRSAFVTSRIAPDFAVPDRKGRIVHLSDFKGKKVLVVTWASW